MDDLMDRECRYRLIVSDLTGRITASAEAKWTVQSEEEERTTTLGILQTFEYRMAKALSSQHGEEFRCTSCSRWSDVLSSWETATFEIASPQTTTFWNPNGHATGVWPRGWP